MKDTENILLYGFFIFFILGCIDSHFKSIKLINLNKEKKKTINLTEEWIP